MVMKTLKLIIALFLISNITFSQDQTIAESNYQIGMFNAASSKKSFTFSKDFNSVSFQISSLPLFANEFKVYSSIGVSGQLTVNKSHFGKVYTYSGIQRIETKIGGKKEHINLGLGLGFKKEINQELEFVCQGGYNALNALDNNRNNVFNSEVGVYYYF